MNKLNKIDPKSALRVVREKGYRQAAAEISCPRSTLFDLRKRYPQLYEYLDMPDIDDALLNLIPEPIHPAAHKLRLWSIEKLSAAAELLSKTKKLPEPIQRVNGMIVDGRNRRIICLLAKVQPDFVDIELPPGMTVKDYVDQRNLLRRHMAQDQLAAHAAERYVEMRQDGKARRATNLRKGKSEGQKVAHRGNSLVFLSQLFGVNRRYIQDAARIQEQDPKVFKHLRDGKVSMADARRACVLGQARTRKPLQTGQAEVAANDVASGASISVPAADEPEPNISARPRLLSLARAVEEVCRQVPEAFKCQFESISAMAQQALKDFAPENIPRQNP